MLDALPPEVPAAVAPARPVAAADPATIDAAIRFRPDRFYAAPLHVSPPVRLMLFALEPGQAVPRHATPSEVLMIVHRGRGSFEVGDQRFGAETGAMIPVGPGVSHGFRAGAERLVVLAVITPNPRSTGLEGAHGPRPEGP